ncbi:MAG TPA: hypothetical protein VNI20_03590, partial [Fimbriimonadaceae bacterium]|nr:hypothetical protein [Fimbriimonadaceae bacterium]
MKTEWVRIAPYVKWGLPGGIFGAAIGGAVPAFMGSDSAPWAWVGLPFGMAIGALAIHVKISKDRASKDVVERVAAEHRDPKVVPKMYGDVESGYETAAWHAIGLLANYRNPVITRNMLQMVDNRLHNKQVTTLDRLGLVRH